MRWVGMKVDVVEDEETVAEEGGERRDSWQVCCDKVAAAGENRDGRDQRGATRALRHGDAFHLWLDGGRPRWFG